MSTENPITGDVTEPTLYVCHLDNSKPLVHPCGKADKALDKAGIKHERIIYGQGQPFGKGTEGTRPDLKEVSGQEKLPVLVLPGGETVVGGGEIKKWAKSQ